MPEIKSNVLLTDYRQTCEPAIARYRQLAQTISREVEASIENARLHQEMEKKQRELQKTVDGIIHALSAVMETKDRYTAQHQRRVAGLACAIAQEMNLSQWQMNGIRIAANLHDIGKIAVPAEILSKPGPLSQDEFDVIKTHPESGYEMLKLIEFPWPVTKSILQHHERLNGSGYPQGLSGDDITLEARILGVADVVEAILSHRPYRPALGMERALGEITEGRNALYDSQVVDACLRLVKKGWGSLYPAASP